jgi:hypothetical protein
VEKIQVWHVATGWSPFPPESQNQCHLIRRIWLRVTKILFALTIINLVAGLLFVTGVIDIDEIPDLYVPFPAAASCFGMFFIWLIMEKETRRSTQNARIMTP